MGTRRRRARILIAGLGNEILMDDGVGIHAVKAFGKDLPKGVRAVEVGTSVLDALHLFEWADRVLAIDAVEAGRIAGSIYRFDAGDADQSGVKASLHELSLVAALRFLREADRPEVTILGVEPERIDFGLELTSTVQSSLPRLVDAAREIVGKWTECEAK